MWSIPAPPSYSGMATPVRPSSAALRNVSRGKVAGLVEFARVRLHFGLGEFANRALEESLFFAEFQIHCVCPRWRSSF